MITDYWRNYCYLFLWAVVNVKDLNELMDGLLFLTFVGSEYPAIFLVQEAINNSVQ